MDKKRGLAAKKEFGNQLKAYRTVAGISQGDLASALMKQQPYIVSIEKGDTGVGIAKMVEISSYFGVKYYQFADPNFPIPKKEELRTNIRDYLTLNNIDPSYLDNDESPGYSKNMDIYLSTNMLSEAKTSYEIAQDYKIMFQEEIKPSKVSDILSKGGRKKLVDIFKPKVGRGNLYQLKRDSTY